MYTSLSPTWATSASDSALSSNNPARPANRQQSKDNQNFLMWDKISHMTTQHGSYRLQQTLLCLKIFWALCMYYRPLYNCLKLCRAPDGYYFRCSDVPIILGIIPSQEKLKKIHFGAHRNLTSDKRPGKFFKIMHKSLSFGLKAIMVENL